MPRTFIVKLEDRELPVEIESSAPGFYRVRVDGADLSVDARRLGGGLSLLVEGKNHEASLARTGDDYDVLLENHRFRFRVLSEDRARRAAARASREATGRREIKASMPGKVIDVLVEAGARVDAKQGLLVIEAMKMENEIKAQGPGEVKEVRVRAGQAVESGEVLIVLE